MITTKEWITKSGRLVKEEPYNYDLHCFAVYNNENEDMLLGRIYPDNINNMNECITALNAGADPVDDGWEDGLGNACLDEGWG